MPFLELSSDVKLFYEIHESSPEKPWLLLLHPLIADISWVFSILEHPTIKKNFNCIAFDFRFHGRTQAPISHNVDYFTLAADMAMGMQKLQLPPVRLLTIMIVSSSGMERRFTLSSC